MSSQIIVPLDVATEADAIALIDKLPEVTFWKVGLELFVSTGANVVKILKERQKKVFLDLKLHDIPNTVAGAVRAVLPLQPHMHTLHAGGGAAMIEAAREAAGTATTRPLLLAVTVLTSLDSSAVHATGVAGGPRQQVLRLARLAVAAGYLGTSAEYLLRTRDGLRALALRDPMVERLAGLVEAALAGSAAPID